MSAFVAAAALLVVASAGADASAAAAAQEVALAEHGFVLVPVRGATLREALPPRWCETVDHAAFALEPFEVLHPRLDAGSSVLFFGDLFCATAGEYTFRVECEGGDALLLIENGSEPVLALTHPDESDSIHDYAYRFDRPRTVRAMVGFVRRGDMRARLKLSWKLTNAGAASFGFEPLPTRVVTPPAEALAARTAAALAARGRVELVELGCTNCHDAGFARALFPRRGAVDLAGVAARVDEAWLRRWIAAPQSLAPGGGMPDVLGEGVAPESVDELIAALRGAAPVALPPAPAIDAAQAASGRALYHSLGCVACHGALVSPAIAFGDRQLDASLPIGPVAAPFGDLAGKWRIDALARFLIDPLAVRTHGRMPSFGLSEVEASALAHYLVQQFGAAPESTPAPSADASAIARGEALCAKLRCDRCHTVGAEAADGAGYPSGASDAVAPPLAKLDPSRGCLAPTRERRGNAPHYELSREQRAALAAALEQVPTKIVTAPLQRTRDLKAALRCDSCHGLQGSANEGKGAGDRDRWSSYFRCAVATDLGDEGRLPPRLDGVGARLQSPWIEKVIADGARARPYLVARMPKFGATIARELTRGLAALEGEWRSDGAPPRASDESLAVIGRRLAGSGGMNCITCHSFGERPSAGTPGLDFLQFRERLRPEAFAAYALAPARFKPGTRMPRYFEEGRSVFEGVLDGDPARQIDALWCWFERASSMPAPEGVPTGERQLLPVGDRPVVVRAFMERAGVRGIAIGTPAGLHFAFDAAQSRLVEAWSGDFLDVAPMWDGRGGNIVGQLGPLVWSAPPGPLLSLESLETAPTSAAAATTSDAVGATRPQFLGYRLEPDGTPTFLWTLAGRGGAIEVDEQFLPDPRPDVLFLRRLEIRGASKEHPVWLAQLDARSTRVDSDSHSLSPTEPGGVVHVTIEIR